MNTFWVGWVVSAFTFAAGTWVTLKLKRLDRLNSTIDAYCTLIEKIEDQALAYWIKGCKDTYDWQLTLNLKRLLGLALKIEKIHPDFKCPNSLYIEFKKSITLPDAATRPVDQRSEIAIKIMSGSANLKKYYEQFK